MAETGKIMASAQAPDAPIPLAHQLPVYAAGVFSNGSAVIASVIVPLWMLQIDPSPLLVGIALGARQLLPVLLSIHGGALMDRIGIRRVMLWFAVTGAVVPFLFPLFPYFAAVVLLQALSGIASTMGWIGTQAQIGAIMKGETRYAGRVTFFNRFAILAGPPAIGAAWDIGGPWGGFGFLGFWGVALLLACIALPKPQDGAAGAGSEPLSQITLRDVLPRPSDYVAAFRLMGVPAIAFVVAVTMLRHAGNGIQTSFYVVYLKEIGISGTLTGVLLSASSVLGGVGSLSAGWLARMFKSYRVLIFTVAMAIAVMAVTPMIGSFVVLLLLSGLRGGFMGVSQPLLISLMAQSAGKDQGKGVGLRTTANRLAILATPVLMGGIAEVFSLKTSFYVTGAILVAILLYVGVRARKTFADGA